MKRIIHILSFMALISVSHISMSAQYLELAVETLGIRVEYIESTNKGLVYVKKCSQCTKEFYSFSKLPTIKKNGKVIPFKTFLTDYWNGKSPTLFLDPKSLSVLRINY